MSVRAVSFDLDATLVDNGFIPDVVAAGCRFVAERTGVDIARIAAANAVEFATYWPLVEESWALGLLTGEEMVREVGRRTLVSCGCHSEQLLDEMTVEHQRLERENARLFDDVKPVIADLQNANVRLGLITNGASDTQRARLACLGMEGWFDVVVISGEVGVVKPDGAVFAMAASGLGVDGSALWHVGDNLATDVLGARSAGHTAVWLNREGAARRPDDSVPDHEIPSLLRLLTIIEE